MDTIGSHGVMQDKRSNQEIRIHENDVKLSNMRFGIESVR